VFDFFFVGIATLIKPGHYHPAKGPFVMTTDGSILLTLFLAVV